MSVVLLVLTDTIEEMPSGLVGSLREHRVVVLNLSRSRSEGGLPQGWSELKSGDYFDPDAFRHDFIRFLEEWPKTIVWRGRSFDELFRYCDDYSLWWTSVGSRRVSSSSPAAEFRLLWTLNRAISQVGSDKVVVKCNAGPLADAIVSRCQKLEIPVETVRSSERGWAPVRFSWVLLSLVRLAMLPAKALAYSWAVSLISRSPKESALDRKRPAVLFKPKLSRNVTIHDGRVELPYWSSFLRQLETECPDVRQKFMLYLQTGKQSRWRIISWLRHTGNQLAGNLDGAVLPPDRFSGLAGWIRALPRQVSALFRYYRMEKTPEFQSSLVFAGADVSTILTPHLRWAVLNMAEWEREVDMLVKTCAQIGNVRAIFVLGEFYPGPMRFIAAARRLSIPVIGAQHGTIFPGHLVYTVPKGHVDGAPTPDFFAVYGEYSREIVCELGAYPKERTWIIGAPRMDHLVLDPPDADAARRALGLPPDKKIVLIATHTPKAYPWFGEAVKAVFEATRDRNDCFICVKTHPGDRGGVKKYETMAAETGNPKVQCYGDRFDELLASCDLLVSGSSTTILEATLLGKPTISVNFSTEPDRFPYVADGASLPAKNSEEMRRSIDRLIEDCPDPSLAEKRQSFLRRHVGPTSCGRGVDTLMERVSPILVGKDEGVSGESETTAVIQMPV